MDPSLDLIDHFKLEAEYLPDCTLHTYYKLDRSKGRRKVKIVKKWLKKEDIGEGTFGTVWLEVEEDGSERAIKSISRRLCSRNSIDYKKELTAMAKLSRYEELFVTFCGWFENQTQIFLAMEYFKHGDLQRHMDKPIPEIQVKIIIVQLLEGLKTMHQLDFTHRDLKPQIRLSSQYLVLPLILEISVVKLSLTIEQNVFVVETSPLFWVKIGDFGITKRITNDQTFLRTEIGTRQYLAPEVLGLVNEGSDRYTNAVDIWSLGCICHRLLTMEAPFANIPALVPYCWGSKELPVEALHNVTVSEEGVLFVKKLMAAHPSKCLKAEAALQSPWLINVDPLDSGSFLNSVHHQSESPEQDFQRFDAKSSQENEPLNDEDKTVGESRETQHQQSFLKGADEASPTTTTTPDSANNMLDPGAQFEPQYATKPSPGANNSEEDIAVLSNNHMSLNVPREGTQASDQTFQKFRDGGFDIENLVSTKWRAIAAFEWAAIHTTEEDLRLFLAEADVINLTDSLHWAIRKNIFSAVRAIIESKKMDINAKGTNGVTALQFACMYEHVDIMRYLLENGADVHAKDYFGRTAKDRIGNTPLLDSNPASRIMKLLKEYGAEYEAEDVEGQRALDTALATFQPVPPSLPPILIDTKIELERCPTPELTVSDVIGQQHVELPTEPLSLDERLTIQLRLDDHDSGTSDAKSPANGAQIDTPVEDEQEDVFVSIKKSKKGKKGKRKLLWGDEYPTNEWEEFQQMVEPEGPKPASSSGPMQDKLAPSDRPLQDDLTFSGEMERCTEAATAEIENDLGAPIREESMAGEAGDDSRDIPVKSKESKKDRKKRKKRKMLAYA